MSYIVKYDLSIDRHASKAVKTVMLVCLLLSNKMIFTQH